MKETGKNKKKFYVTTPIYYATAAPHLGTLYSTVLADVCARWHTISGDDVYFLTGTDEFGQKIAQAAQDAKMEPQNFVDSFIHTYKDIWKKYHIDYSQFMRTTHPFHIKAVQGWLKKLLDKGDIYKGEYVGWYCVPCETYFTDKDKQAGLSEPLCLSCQRSTKKVSEISYFFKLSAYQERLLRFYETHPEFIIPSERYAEVISFVKSGLQDISISRSTIKWGVPFPDDDAHVTYVWADALNNYITAIGYGQEDKKDFFQKWWPADMQVMGKDIVRFHAIYWPAFLMAADLGLPKHLLVHGWIKVGDQKMSKSLGNSIDPQILLEKYGADQVRYYLLKQLAINQDGNFNIKDLEQKITSDLANDLGNLLNRLMVLAEKNNIQTISSAQFQEDENKLQESLKAMIDEMAEEMNRGYFHIALSFLWKGIGLVNSYFHTKEPWKLAKQDPVYFKTVLSATAHGLYTIAILLWPVMPIKMEVLLQALGRIEKFNSDCVSALLQEPWNKEFKMQKIDPLFEKFETKSEEALQAALEPQEPVVNEIGIEDFLKVELRVGTILSSTKVSGSDKLLRLEVNFGDCGKRIIFSGIQKMYETEKLIGKQAVFVFNLKPRKMMGEFSHGMLLAIGNDSAHFSIIVPENKVIDGALLK